VHHQYTGGIVRFRFLTLPNAYVHWQFTARQQAYTGSIAFLVIQNAAFNTVHTWAGVVGQADFALWSVKFS
jgi:hypothetical protein